MAQDFLELFKEALEIEDRDITMTDNFREYEEWDSLANLSVVAMIDDEYDVVIEAEEFKSLETIEQLWLKIQSLKNG